MIIPPSINHGDSVAIVAPSGIIERDAIDNGISKMEGWGLKVIKGDNLYKDYGIFAGNDQERLDDLQKALDDPLIKAVFCARGGYGLSRIISSLDLNGLRSKPKWVIGYSDITILHLWINQNLGMATLHAEMPINYNSTRKSAATIDTLRNAIAGRPVIYSWDAKGVPVFIQEVPLSSTEVMV